LEERIDAAMEVTKTVAECIKGMVVIFVGIAYDRLVCLVWHYALEMLGIRY